MARAHLAATVEGPVILYVHGGGFALNSLDTHDVLCRAMALQTRCRVVSVDYRRPPDAPFEAVCEDVMAAFRHCIDLARGAAAVAGDAAAASGGPGAEEPRVVVTGDSAGGHLVVSLTLQLLAARAEAANALDSGGGSGGDASAGAGADAGVGAGAGAAPAASQRIDSATTVLLNDDVRRLAALPLPVLVAPLYGAFDLTEATTESRELYAEGWVLSERIVGLFAKHLSHGRSSEATAALRASPFASPVRAPAALLSRMPPTLLVAAEHDMLRDDSHNMLAALRASGAQSAELVLARGQIHGFAQFPRELPHGRRFLEAEVYPRMRAALRGALSVTRLLK